MTMGACKEICDHGCFYETVNTCKLYKMRSNWNEENNVAEVVSVRGRIVLAMTISGGNGGSN
jgi:hypothetical protein